MTDIWCVRAAGSRCTQQFPAGVPGAPRVEAWAGEGVVPEMSGTNRRRSPHGASLRR